MKNLVLFIFIFSFPLQTAFSQQSKVPFEVHQMLYYENIDCQNSELQDKYTIIYQNFYDASKYIIYHLNSFNDSATFLYLINQNKVMHYEHFVLQKFNAASQVELHVNGFENMDDLDNLSSSKVKLKYIEKESVIRDNRMLTAYHFKVKNFDRAKKIIYYIDHGSSGIPFSFHESFYEEMRSEGFPLIGNVVQRDELRVDGDTCTFVLRSNRNPNKKFHVVFN